MMYAQWVKKFLAPPTTLKTQAADLHKMTLKRLINTDP